MAVQAQVTAEEWESAAKAEHLLSLWYTDSEASAEQSQAHLAQAAEYAARVPPGEVMCHVAATQAFDLIVSGSASEALTLTTDASDRRTAPESRWAARCCFKRAGWLVLAGRRRRTGRHADRRRSPRAACQHLRRQRVCQPGQHLVGFGDMPAADQAYKAANHWATRFGRADDPTGSSRRQAEPGVPRRPVGQAQRLLDRIETRTLTTTRPCAALAANASRARRQRLKRRRRCGDYRLRDPDQ